MKFAHLLLYFFFLPAGIAAQQQKKAAVTRIYNEEGRLQMSITYDPDCPCRTYTEYYADGKIFARRRFRVEGKKEFIDGEDIDFYHDGSIKKYRQWKNALPEGRAYASYPNGKLRHEEFFAGKYKTGTWKYFDSSGVLIQEKIFQPGSTAWDSKQDNAVYKYYRSGKLIRTENIAAGKSSKPVKDTRLPPIAIADGKTLFIRRCSACHEADKDGYGPALRDVVKKRKKEWLFQMIKNGKQLVEAGDKEATALFRQWRNIPHPSQERLTDQQIHAVMNYLKKMD